ncbi:hypothetical protein LCGC14_1208520 [marine sediment metagenome]|uniref:Uncharacterized protein n=1 Tax=marine sediment metagenome TaxID=412755 RepID=A0A0F9NX33_9ZZZZ
MKWLYLLRGRPTYCRKCGRKLTKEQRNIRYDGHTGKPTRVLIIHRCSEYIATMSEYMDHCMYHWAVSV